MAYRLQPTVYIAGTTVPADWTTTSNVVALANLQIDWGRDNVWDKPRPARAAITVIDRVGVWASSPTMYGAEFRVERPPVGNETGVRTLFRGKVDTVSIRRGTADGEGVWFVDLTASDTLAELQKRNPPGVPIPSDPYPEYHESLYGPGYWGNLTLSDILSKCNDLITSISSYIILNGVAVKNRPRDSSSDLLTLLYEVGLEGGNQWPQFNAGPRTISWGQITTMTGGTALNYSSGVLKIGTYGNNVVVDGGKLIHTGDGKVVSGMDKAISVVQAKTRLINTNTKQSFQTDGGTYSFSKETEGVVISDDVDGNWPGSNLLAIDSAFQEYTYPGSPRGTVIMFVSSTAAKVAEMNGKALPPPCRYDFERFSYGGSMEQMVLSPEATGWVIVLSNTPYMALTGWGIGFQIIGGTMRWEDGWTVDPIWSPTRGGPDTAAVVNYGPGGKPWVTNVDAEYQDFDAAMTYADFAIVTRGAA